MTCLDTIIYLVSAIGEGLLVVLLFSRTILSVKWWKYDTIHNIITRNEKGRHERIDELELKSFARAKTKRQRFKNINQLSNRSELVNKKVNTCEMIEIGRIISIDSYSVTIKGDSGQEYVISTYWIRGCDKEIAVLDTSIRYLHHYQAKQITTVAPIGSSTS